MKIEEFIEDNKKNIKHTLEPKDLAMLVQESIVNKKTVCTHFYIYIIEITRNISKNIGEWWNVRFYIPPTSSTLILRTEQMTGQEIFTMGGRKMAMLPVDFSRVDEAVNDDGQEEVEQPSQKKKKPRSDKPKSGRSRSHLTVVK